MKTKLFFATILALLIVLSVTVLVTFLPEIREAATGETRSHGAEVSRPIAPAHDDVGKLPSTQADEVSDDVNDRITAASTDYLEIVYADGLPSAEKAQQRLETFESAVAELASLGPDAIPALLSRLSSTEDEHDRLLLLTGISRVEGVAGAQGVLDALRLINDSTIEHLFLDRLTRSADPQNAFVMEAVLAHAEDPQNRIAIIANAASRGIADFAEYLPDIAATDPSPLVRMEALLSAERLDSTIEATVLEDIVVSDPSDNVRRTALELYAATHPEGFVEFASEVLESVAEGNDPAVGLALVRSLADSTEPAAAEVLDELAQRAPPGALRRQATIALEKFNRAQRRQAGASQELSDQ